MRRDLVLAITAVSCALLLVWAMGVPLLLSLDRYASAAAGQLGAIGAGLTAICTLLIGRSAARLQSPAFAYRVAIGMAAAASLAASAMWLFSRPDPRMPDVEAFSVLCLQVASGWGLALLLFVLSQAPRQPAPGDPLQLPGIRRIFTLSAAALGLFAAVLLGVGSAGRAAAVRDQLEGQRLAPLSEMLAQALTQTDDQLKRARIVGLLDADLHARAELRPADRPPPEVAEAEPSFAAANAHDGVRLMLLGERRWHFARRQVGRDVLWLRAPANVRPPVLAPDDTPAMLILALLLLGAPLAALGVGHDLVRSIDDVTRGLLGMGPGQPAHQTHLGVAISGNDEVGDLSDALNRLCRRYATERERLAEDLSAATALDRSRSRFLASASRALRVPLERVAAHCRVLTRNEMLAPSQREDVDAIVGATDQLLSHVDEILALSRIEAGHHKPLRRVTLGVGDLARAVVAASRMNAREGVALGLSVDPRAPQISADAHRIRQVLQNLVGNALKFTTEGFVQVAVGPGEGGGIHIQVADSGPGIPASELDRIFTEFHRVEAHRQVAGTGLGLAISRRLVERHGGQLWAESVPGEGSVFHVRLPADGEAT